MAKVKERRLWVDPPAADQGVVKFRWYYGLVGDDLVAMVDSAQDEASLPPFFETAEPEVWLGRDGNDLTEGKYQFVATGLDAVGNESTPYQHTAWGDATIDITSPDPLTGGGIE